MKSTRQQFYSWLHN